MYGEAAAAVGVSVAAAAMLVVAVVGRWCQEEGVRRTGEACPALADPTEASLHLRQQLVHDRVPPRPLARAVHRVGIVVVGRRVLDLPARHGIIARALSVLMDTSGLSSLQNLGSPSWDVGAG